MIVEHTLPFIHDFTVITIMPPTHCSGQFSGKPTLAVFLSCTCSVNSPGWGYCRWAQVFMGEMPYWHLTNSVTVLNS